MANRVARPARPGCMCVAKDFRQHPISVDVGIIDVE
jgi:hypothetical protein